MMKSDPIGPRFLVKVFDPGLLRPTRRKTFICNALKISRTYSLSAQVSKHATSGVSIRNNVFSDLTGKETLTWSIEENTAEQPEPWRRGYYDKPRAWEQVGPQAGDVTELTRKHMAQKTHRNSRMPVPKRSLEDRLSAKARALSRQAAKRRRQMAAQKTAEDDNSSSTSSSSSSESSP